MKKYIDSEKLIAEIRRIVEEETPISKGSDYYHGVADTADKLLSFITSLQKEQPGVDLEEYIENEINHYGLSLYKASYGTFSASQIDRIIRNSFELGLKASK